MITTRTWWIVAASLACSVSTTSADGMHKNGLSAEAFSKNALTVNPDALNKLVSRKLNLELLSDATIARQLSDVNAQAVMTEIVRCALPVGTSLDFVDPLFGAHVTFKGEVGICSNAALPAGDWSQALPTPTCLHLVTSCVAARVNGVDRSVPISMRSPIASVPAPLSVVDTDTTYRFPVTGDPGVGQTISSFIVTALSHWVVGADGTCTPNASVKLLGSGACHVRVCTNIAGCLASGANPPPGVQVDSAFRAEGDCAPKELSFTCPPSGFFTTMFLVIRFATPPPVTAKGATYPAPETKVFDKLEGGFYGNMFDAGALVNYTCKVGDDNELDCVPKQDCGKNCDWTALPYNHVYGCFSTEIAHDNDVYGAQYTQDRVCGRTDHCFAHAPARCHYGADNDNQTKGSHCTKANGLFGTCFDPTGSDRTPYETITTYLNGACDLVNLTQCNAFNPTLATGVDPTEPSVETGDGGCAVGRGRGGLVTLVLAMIAIALARRSRR